MLNRIYFLLFAFLLTTAGYAQDSKSCKDKLKDANRAYDEGRVSEVENLIRNCIKDLERDKQKEAYRLLTLTGLYLDNREMAEQNMQKFLRIEKEYKPVRGVGENSEPPEFVELFDKFYTKPIYLYGLKVGATYSLIQPTLTFSVDNNLEAGNYAPRIGFLIGAMFDLPITDNLHIGAEAFYATRSYSHSDSLLNFAKTTFIENQSLIEIPVYARFLFRNVEKRFRPYVTGGVFGNFLLSSKADVTRNDLIDAAGGNTRSEEIFGVDMSSQRKRLGLGAMLGGGFMLKTKAGLLTVDFRYNLGLTNMVNPAKRGSNSILVNRFGYIDDNMIASPLVFSIGFYIPKYNPRLKKEYRRNIPKKKGKQKKSKRRRKK